MDITYYAIFKYDNDSINVSFPNLNIFTCADSKYEAIQMAKEALELSLFGLKKTELPKSNKIESKDINTEIVPITVTMTDKNGLLYCDGVIEY